MDELYDRSFVSCWRWLPKQFYCVWCYMLRIDGGMIGLLIIELLLSLYLEDDLGFFLVDDMSYELLFFIPAF